MGSPGGGAADRPRRIAIVGAGPSGIYAAEALAQQAAADGQVTGAVFTAAPGVAGATQQRGVDRQGARHHAGAAGQAVHLGRGHQVGTVADQLAALAEGDAT